MSRVDLTPRQTPKMKMPAVKAKPVPTRKYEQFGGIDWSASIMRPGCQDFLDHPSRVGEKRLPYRTPILNASTNIKGRV